MSIYTSEFKRVPKRKARRFYNDSTLRRVQLVVHCSEFEAAQIQGAAAWAFRNRDAFLRDADEFATRVVLTRLKHIEAAVGEPADIAEVSVAPLPVSFAARGDDTAASVVVWLTEKERLNLKRGAVSVYKTRAEYRDHGCAGMARAIIMDNVKKAERLMTDAGWILEKARGVYA